MKDFRIEISSDLDYEGMVVDILYLDNLLAKLNCDQGLEKTQILIFDQNEENSIWEVNYFLFQVVLNEAFQKLKEANNLN